MAKITTASGPELSAALRDATPLMGRMGDLAKGEPPERVIHAAGMLLTFRAAKAGLTEEEFITYARQMFIIAHGAVTNTLPEAMERFRKEG